MGQLIGGLLALAAALLAIGGILALPVAIGIWIMGPLDKAAKSLQRPTQFTIVDFLCLFFILQMPMAIIHGSLSPSRLSPDDDQARAMVLVLDGFVWFACGAMWWACVRTLSRAGIEPGWRRAVFLAIVLPITIFSVVAAPGLCMGLVGTLDSPRPEDAGLLALALVGLGIVVTFCGLFTRRLVLQTRLVAAELVPPDEELPPEIEGGAKEKAP